MIFQTIPLQPSSQKLNVNLNGSTYYLHIIWRGFGYVLDIYEGSTALARGLALVTGADLLSQLEYLNIPGAWLIVSEVNPFITPTYSSLGISSQLVVGQ